MLTNIMCVTFTNSNYILEPVTVPKIYGYLTHKDAIVLYIEVRCRRMQRKCIVQTFHNMITKTMA